MPHFTNTHKVAEPLILTAKELENIARGGKICMISLAAGNGHKETAKAIKNLLKETYGLQEDTFFDPNNSAANHPGVKMWNRWQKNENVNGLFWMIRLQTLVDQFHYWGVRIGLCRQMLSVGVAKVIDTQTNSTEAICEAVGDYNQIREKKWADIPLSIRFFHGILNLDTRVWNIVWASKSDAFFKKVFCTIMYLFVFSFALLFKPINILFEKLSTWWSDTKLNKTKHVTVKNDIRTVKVLTDSPIYDENNTDFSTVNYFNALLRLHEGVIKRSNLHIVSPPLALPPSPAGTTTSHLSQMSFFSNPWSKSPLQDCVTFLVASNMLVRPGFKLSPQDLYRELCAPKRSDPSIQSDFSKNPGTFYVSMMLGGNGGESLISYVQSLTKYLHDMNYNYNGFTGEQKLEISVFCGRNEQVKDQIETLSKNMPENLVINAYGFVSDERIIAGVIRQADVHITRPGGISMFELDAMQLTDTEVLFHTPNEENNKPSVGGLLNWERSNALWYIARRYGLEETRPQIIPFLQKKLSACFSKNEVDTLLNPYKVTEKNGDIDALSTLLDCFLTSDTTLTNNIILKSRLNNIKKNVLRASLEQSLKTVFDKSGACPRPAIDPMSCSVGMRSC